LAVDLISALVAYLKNEIDVDSIYGGELPRSENTSMPHAAIVVKRAGGFGGEAYQRYSTTRIDVDCYGPTLLEASELWDSVKDCLKQMRRNVTSGVLIHSASVSADGVTAHDTDTDWPMCVGSFSVLAAEVEAT
jgi:hypothetical protein